MSSLQRTCVNDFKIEDAIELDEVKENVCRVISIEKYFENNLAIKLDGKRLGLFLNGVKLSYNLDDGLYRVYDLENNFIGVGAVQNNLLKRELVL